ncbi:MAG: Gfo/Idh/MocA family oxidoreductase [Candidatus Omnitrophica bacterium]|nr:Gfo/Idh/MocA family oxidoreductase [Candidatus Omnitrophota bacterium]
MKKIKVAVIGVGHLGARHLKTYCQLKDIIELVGVSDVNKEHGQKIAREFHTTFFPDYHELIGKVEAVSICTPTISHCEVGLTFLNAGVHTLVEKPIAMDLNEANKLIDAAARNNLKLQIGHIERFNNAFQAIKDIAHNAKFIECHRLNHFPNRSLDIGVVMDLMIHDIDIVQGLINEPLTDIQAIGINVLTDKDDIANVRLTFANKSVCNLTASRVSPEVMRKIRIFIPNAYISLDYVKQEAFIYTKEGSSINRKSLPIEKEEPLKRELSHFIECVRENKKPIVSGIEGRDALSTALAIQKIIWTDHLQKSS